MISFDNSFVRDLPEFYQFSQPQKVAEPVLLFINQGLSAELQLDLTGLDESALAAVFSGNRLPQGAQPIAQAYSGHQFGHFNPQLGDGRALLIGEVIDCHGKRRDIAFKGSGRTAFSRRGDGKAALGPMLREVLIGEAMQALGIPTTRALAVVATGEPLYREQVLSGAILTRVAASHLRVGTFEYAAAHGGPEQLRRLADYAIRRHFPESLNASRPSLDFLSAVAERQAMLVAQWMLVGFIHGVMNTDNMSIAGESIDFGPCAFMETYDPNAVFSSIDAQGRYAYQAQPGIARWNLARLAETLLPLIDTDRRRAIELATGVIDGFMDSYQAHWLAGLRAKLGLKEQCHKDNTDKALGERWLELLQAQGVDFTLVWRYLADAAQGNEAPLRTLFSEHSDLDRWLVQWRERCRAEDVAMPDAGADAKDARARAMRLANPWIIPRNHLVEEALAAASNEANLQPFEQLLNAVRRPFAEDQALAPYAEPASSAFMADFCTFCGT